MNIIIPVYKNEKLTIRCINYVALYTSKPYRLIVVDDGSPRESSREVIEHLTHTALDYEYYKFSENRGPAAAINQGFRMSDSKHIAVLNNDVMVTEGWLGKLAAALESSAEIGLVGALTDHASSVCRYDRAARLLGLSVEGDPADFFNRRPLQTLVVGTNVSYFCMAIKREVLEHVGYLHEGFYMGAEDDDYNDRIRVAGYLTAVCVNCFVYHDHHATLDLIPGIQERRRRNVALLRQRREERARRTA